MRLRLLSDLNPPLNIFRVHAGWFTPVGPEEVEHHSSFTFTGKWDVVVFVPTNTPARYQMKVVWPKKASFTDRLNESFEELRRLNRASLAEIRDAWVHPWSWYGEEIVESDLITNFPGSAQ